MCLALLAGEAAATDSLVIRGQAFIVLTKSTYINLTSITSPSTPYVLTSVSSLTALCDSAGITELTQMFPEFTGTVFGDTSGLERLYSIRYDAMHDPDSLMQSLEWNADIEYAFPNVLCSSMAATPNDPLFSQQQWMTNLEMTDVWDRTKGSETVKVAVIDGFFYEHPDFEADPPLFPENVYDEEKDFVNFGDSFFSTPHGGRYYHALNGLDYTTYDDDAVEPQVITDWAEPWDHGTAITGIIATTTDNSTGVAGMCWNVHYICVRVWVPMEHSLTPQGSRTQINVMRYEDFLHALHWIVNPGGDRRADVVNMSFGYDRSIRFSLGPTWDRMRNIMDHWFRQGVAKGVTWVAAAGNYDYDGYNGPALVYSSYPASSPYVISVGGVRLEDYAPTVGLGLSCLGEEPSDLDLVAFNAQILTTRTNYSSGAFEYNDFGGTSGAAPMVTAACALLKSIRPDLDPDGLRAVLCKTAVKVGDPQDYYPDAWAKYGSWAERYGYGRLDIKAALAFADEYMDVTVRNVLQGSPMSQGNVNVNGTSQPSPYHTDATFQAAAPITARTELLPFAEQSVIGTADQKMWRWIDIVGQEESYPLYELYHTFRPIEAIDAQAKFKLTLSTDIQSRLDGSTAYAIEKYFKDPFRYFQYQSVWYHDNVFRREDTQIHLTNQTGTSGGVIGGVPEQLLPLNEPYYAFQYARALEDVGGGYAMAPEIAAPTEGDVFLGFIRKSGSALLETGSPSVSQEGFETTPMRFKDHGSEFTLWYKGHLSSMGEQSPTARPSQRKVAIDAQTGTYHCVYPSNGDVYYTSSTNRGQTWSKELLISSGYGLAADPSIVVCEAGVFTAFNHDGSTIEIVLVDATAATPLVSLSHNGGSSAVPAIAAARLNGDEYLVVVWETPYCLEYFVGKTSDPEFRNTAGILRTGAYDIGGQLQPRFASVCGHGHTFGTAWAEGGWILHRLGKLSLDPQGDPYVTLTGTEIIHNKWYMPVAATGSPSLTSDLFGNFLCAYETVNTWAPIGSAFLNIQQQQKPRLLYVCARNYRGTWRSVGYALGSTRNQSTLLAPSIGYDDPGSGYRNHEGIRVPFNYDNQSIGVLAFEPSGITLRSQVDGGASQPSITTYVPAGKDLLNLYSVNTSRTGFDFHLRSTQAALAKTKEYELFPVRELAVIQDTSFASLTVCELRLMQDGAGSLDLHWDEQHDTTALENLEDLRYWFTSDTIQAGAGDQIRLFVERFRSAGWPESDLVFHFQVWRAIDGSLIADSTLAPTDFPTDSADVWSLCFALEEVAGEAVFLTLSITGTDVSADDVLIYRKYLDITDVDKSFGEPRASEPRPDGIALRTFPNPVTNVLRIDCDAGNEVPVRITLHDVLGRELRTIAADGRHGRGTYQLDTQSLVPGMYYISAIAGARKTVAPFVVVR